MDRKTSAGTDYARSRSERFGAEIAGLSFGLDAVLPRTGITGVAALRVSFIV